jgi:plastocyanin
MRKTAILLIALMVISVGLLSGCNQQQTTTKEANTVTIRDFAFDPETLTVKAGTNVTWINEGPSVHTITASGLFDSGEIIKGDSFKYAFNTVGTFNYSCSIHSSMKGKIIVE